MIAKSHLSAEQAKKKKQGEEQEEEKEKTFSGVFVAAD